MAVELPEEPVSGFKVRLFTSGTSFQLTPIGTGSNTQLRVSVPSSGPLNGAGQVQVSNSGGDSNLFAVNVVNC